MNKIIEKIKNKKVILAFALVLIGLIVVSGTYAFMTIGFNGVNDNYTVAVECFKVNYSIDNDDGTQNIEGTLWPSTGPSKGLSGKVSIGMDSSCNVSGTGTLKLHIGENTSSVLTQTVAPHCENSSTLETLDDYDTYDLCESNGGKWVTEGTGLKYAVYDNNTATGDPLSSGYIKTDDIDTDVVVYDNFNISSRQLNLYVFIWLDGHVTDNSYVNQSIEGYISATVVQNEYGVVPSAPVLDESGMIPVTIDNSGNVTTISEDDPNWYNYGEKKWANAILVNETSRSNYLNTTGTPVTKSDILAYYVWIPKYSYKMNSTSGAGNESEISISFDYNDEGYIPHPAFKFGNEYIDGFWTGKFETTGTAEEPTILDGVSPLENQTISEQFTSSLLDGNFDDTNRTITFNDSPTYGLSSTTDSHMMKNSEWGAVAYLSHSQYGTCTNGVCQEVRYNNYIDSGRMTGCGAATADTTSYSSTCTLAYGSGINEYPQSTTGNITGVFDMSGGAYEYVMGNYSNTKGIYWSYTNLPPTKYYDVYTTLAACTTETCGGHALTETKSWYGNRASFVDSSGPWFLRGGDFFSGAYAGVWEFSGSSGNSNNNNSWRSVVIPKVASVGSTGGSDDSSSSEIVVTLDNTAGNGWDTIYDWIDNSGDLLKNFSLGDTYGDLPIPDGEGAREFIGWYTEQEGGMLVTSDMQLISDEDHTLYAHWDLVTVTLDQGDGWFEGDQYGWTVDGNALKEYVPGSIYGDFPEIYHDYKNFFGWYTESNCNGTLVTSDMQLVSDEAHTLYPCLLDAQDN